MKPHLTDMLCTRCGMCCNGSFLADVELRGRAEAERLEAMGLEIEENDEGGWLLVQPCRALKRTWCSVYAHRPECCQTFECRLLQGVRLGTVSLEQAQERIAEAKERLERVRRLGRRAKFQAGTTALAFIRKTFLVG